MGLRVAPLEHVVIHAHTNKSCYKSLTYIQQTVYMFTKEHVYRYATLLLGVCVCLWGVCIDTYVRLRVTFVGGCVTGRR